MRNNEKPWFDDQCRPAFILKQEAHFRWTRDRSRGNWEVFVCCQVRANETYSKAKRKFSGRNRYVLVNVQSHHKWWSTLKSAVFDSSSSLPPLVSGGGGLVCDLIGKANLQFNCLISRIILTASSPSYLLICHYPSIRLLVLPPLPSGRVRSGVSC